MRSSGRAPLPWLDGTEQSFAPMTSHPRGTYYPCSALSMRCAAATSRPGMWLTASSIDWAPLSKSASSQMM